MQVGQLVPRAVRYPRAPVSTVCPSCQAPLPPADVDQSLMVARCAACGGVFDCSAEAGAALVQRRRPPVPLPPGFTVTEAPRAPTETGYREAAPRGGPPVTIVRRWYAQVAWFMALFLVLWFSILSRVVLGDSTTPLPFRLFPLLHVAAGLFVGYWTLALFFNRSTVRITDDELSVTHAPLPWPGNLRIRSAELTQIFTQLRVTQGKNGEIRTYDVVAIMNGGERRVLVKGLAEPDQALFLEQRIEERLGIVDVAVMGEYQGPAARG